MHSHCAPLLIGISAQHLSSFLHKTAARDSLTQPQVEFWVICCGNISSVEAQIEFDGKVSPNRANCGSRAPKSCQNRSVAYIGRAV
jgi:hypothetical protein